MSTAAVAKLLGVSRRTVMRWVDQIGMHLEKNELGHYQFTDVDIDHLRQIQEQANAQAANTPISQPVQKGRTGVVKSPASIDANKVNALNERVDDLERRIRSKADDVVSYQILQHRKEMEELLGKITMLEEKVEKLESNQQKREPIKDKVLVFDQPTAPQRPKRKNLISSIFSL